MIRIQTVFTGPLGAPWLSTMYFTGSLASEAVTANADVGTFWSAADALMSSSVSWATDSDAAVVDAATGQITAFHSVTPQTGSGASAGDLLPRQSQMLVRWFTSTVVGGRLLRGRTFVPGVTEAFNGAGVPASAAISTLQAAADALETAGNLMIWSRTAGVNHFVTSASVWSQWATLRSRRD